MSRIEIARSDHGRPDALERAVDRASRKTALASAVAAERERIANRLEEESDLAPCKEDGAVYRSAAWLVRADFSYEEAERLEIAAESAVSQQRTQSEKSDGA